MGSIEPWMERGNMARLRETSLSGVGIAPVTSSSSAGLVTDSSMRILDWIWGMNLHASRGITRFVQTLVTLKKFVYQRPSKESKVIYTD